MRAVDLQNWLFLGLWLFEYITQSYRSLFLSVVRSYETLGLEVIYHFIDNICLF